MSRPNSDWQAIDRLLLDALTCLDHAKQEIVLRKPQHGIAFLAALVGPHAALKAARIFVLGLVRPTPPTHQLKTPKDPAS